MPFTEETKLAVKRKSHFKCCLCHALGIEIHHIVPQADGGLDTQDNAAPLCPSCHETYGANSGKRKFIREARDFWYELCEKRYASDPEHLNGLKRVEDGLTEIHAGVRAIQEPLLPCGLFYTLKYECNDEDVNRILARYENYTVFGPDASEAIPFVPPDMSGVRLVVQGHYIDYLDGVVKAAGIFRPEHPGYNDVHSDIRRRICFLTTEGLRQAMSRKDHLPCPTTSVQVEFFFDGNPATLGTDPSLVLKSSLRSATTLGAVEVLDNLLVVDTAVKKLDILSSKHGGWSTNDLRNSHLRVTLEFFFIQGINDIPRESWPSLHNLQLWIGPNANQVLTFSLEQLASQLVREHPNPVAKGQAEIVQVLFECAIDENMYAKHLLSTA